MTPTEYATMRKELGLTQSALAQVLNVHPMTISKWERGAASPDLEMLRVLMILVRYRRVQVSR